MPEVAITELLEIDPERVDAVSKPANGTDWLILKAIDENTVDATEATMEDVLAELDKADGESRPPCPLCKGAKTIKDGHVKCPKCLGTGFAPKVGDSAKTLIEAAKASDGAAASGVDVPLPKKCVTCNGSGTLQRGGGVCPDCDGTGDDNQFPPDDKLNRQDGFAGKVTEGDPDEKNDGFNDSKLEEHLKAEMSGAAQNDLPDSAFAYIEDGGKKDDDGKTTPRSLRHFPVHDAAHARNALARASQSPFGDKAMPKIKAAAKKFGIEVNDDANKAVADGATFTAPNPALAAMATKVGDDSDDMPDGSPGSPAWEAVDAATATAAAQALMTAAELIREFAQRESIEVVAGEGNDIYDSFTAHQALCAVNDALGTMAQMAFHEGLEAAKSLPDDETVEKAGRRLAGKTVNALAAARDKAKDLADHIGSVLGDDDPAKKKMDSGIKSADNSEKDILDMTEDDLQKLVATTVAQAVVAATAEVEKVTAEAEKAAAPDQDVDNSDSIAAGKKTNAKAKAKDPKAENKDLEDDADQGDNDSASSPAMGAAKADAEDDVEPELTPAEIEANDAAKAAKKEAKRLRKAAEEAATKAAVTKSIEESLTKVVEQNEVLKATVETLRGELDGVKQMAAPSTIVRTRPQDAITKSAERDALDLELAKYERLAKSASDMDYRRECSDRAKALRVKIAAMTS